MPTSESMYLLSADNSPVQELTNATLQVDQLVLEMKENLKLSPPTMKTRSNVSRKSSRASPYNITSSVSCVQCGRDKSCFDCVRKQRLSKQQHKQDQSDTLDDPYELLQQLLRDGDLIKEAVRRLQLDSEPKQILYYDSEEDVYSTSPRKFDASKCLHEDANAYAKCDTVQNVTDCY